MENIMSTGVESWSAEAVVKIDALYPFVGPEVIMTVIAVVIWIVWHIWQLKFESKTIDEQVSQLQGETLKKIVAGEEDFRWKAV